MGFAMPSNSNLFPRSVVAALRRAITGPQGLAFLPALTLAAYWFGGEGLLLAAALGVPGIIAAASLLTRSGTSEAGFDRLTGLPQRDRFEREIDEIILASPSGGSATACLVIGIDDYPRLSTRLGRDAADNVVSGVADRMLGAVRDSDHVARIDSGVLAIALSPAKRTDLETLIRIAGRIQATLTEPFSVEGVKIFVSASVGIAPPSRITKPSGARLVDAALTALDAARVEASGAIRTYSDTMKPSSSTVGAKMGDLASALDGGAIEPWFQPVVDVKTQQILGLEALARWHHPDRGVLTSDAFLDQIVAAGLSQRLTEIILYNVCTHQVAWDQTGLDMPRVWMNLAQEDFANPKLPEKLEKQLKRFDLRGARFGFEIAEEVLRTSADGLIGRNLRALSQLGCDIVLDQFGVSPVSIVELRKYSVHTLKIDHSVTRGIDRNPDQLALFEACFSVGKSLNLSTIATGIENAAQHNRAVAVGCDAVQGGLIAAPMPAENILAWVRKHRENAPVAAIPERTAPRRGIG